VPVLFRMIYACGLRCSEARLLRPGDVDIAAGVLQIRDAKGGKDRQLPVSEPLRERLAGYHAQIAGQPGRREWFFPGSRSGEPLTLGNINRNFRRFLWQARISHRGRGHGPRAGSLGAILPIALVEPDGLIVTTDGRYVRVIECDRVPNTITADPSELGRIEDCFAHLCRIIPDRQGLTILAQTDPVPIDDALARDARATKIAAARDQLAGQPKARRRPQAADGRHSPDRARGRRCGAAGCRGAVVGRRALPASDRR
jgi:hypothetical protein